MAYISRFLQGALCVLLISAGGVMAEGSSIYPKEFEIQPGVKLIVESLNRTKDDSVLMKYQVKNESTQAFSLGMLGSWSPDSMDLLHFPSRKIYQCLTLSGYCYGARWGNSSRKIPPGMSRSLWVQYTSPPAEINEVSLKISDLLPFDGLIIEPVPK